MNTQMTGHGSPDLDSAISAWKNGSVQAEALSEVARIRILARAANPGRHAPPLRALFFPLRQLVLAGALPLVLLTGLIGYVTLQSLVATPGVEHPPISASKTSDGEVIFKIANGKRVHRVYMSTSPDRFEQAPGFTTRDGAFRDRLDGGPDLVFYRID